MALDRNVFDPAEYLNDAESVAAYLEDAIEDGDPVEFLEALEVVARAKGMSEPAPKASGHPDFATVVAALRSLGVGIRMVPTPSAPEPTATPAG